MIQSFAVDPMHCIYQNSVRDFVFSVLSTFCKQNRNMSWASTSTCLGERWKNVSLPKEFNRSTRSFIHHDTWKATEFRTFLLYGGDELIASYGFSEDVSSIFRKFSLGVRLLSDAKTCHDRNKLAADCLNEYLKELGTFFGDHHVKLAVHQLSHLADDVRRLGPLDTYSAFPFENALKTMKVRYLIDNIRYTFRNVCKRQ